MLDWRLARPDVDSVLSLTQAPRKVAYPLSLRTDLLLLPLACIEANVIRSDLDFRGNVEARQFEAFQS